MFSFLAGCREELRKVVWPDREEVINSTVVVLIAVTIVSVFLFGTDMVFESIFDALVSLGIKG